MKKENHKLKEALTALRKLDRESLLKLIEILNESLKYRTK